MRFTVLRSKAISRWICDKQQQPPLVAIWLQQVNGKLKIRCLRRQYTVSSRLFKDSKHG